MGKTDRSDELKMKEMDTMVSFLSIFVIFLIFLVTIGGAIITQPVAVSASFGGNINVPDYGINITDANVQVYFIMPSYMINKMMICERR